jgi:hypothetical protein
MSPDRSRLGERGRSIDIDVAIALEVRDYGNAALGLDAFDQRATAARHDDVDEFGHAEHDADCGAVTGRDQLYGAFGEVRGFEALVEAPHDRARGMETF